MTLPHWINVPALTALALACFYFAWCAWLARGRLDAPDFLAEQIRWDVRAALFLLLPVLWCAGKVWDLSDRLTARRRMGR